jgi:hypothetical protein
MIRAGVRHNVYALFTDPSRTSGCTIPCSMHKILADVWNWYPPVGVFIGILALVSVLVPLFRNWATIHKGEKAVWTSVMFALVLLEMHSIFKDREAHEKEFARIAEGIDKTISDNQAQFSVTMGGLETAINNSGVAARNTEPTARFEVQNMSLTADPLPANIDSTFGFVIYFTNVGTEKATDIIYDARFFFKKPGDLESEKEIAKDFDVWWSTTKHRSTFPVAQPLDPYHDPFTMGKFDKATLDDLTINHSLAVYVLTRFVYSDHSGRWASDRCEWITDITAYPRLAGHVCMVHDNRRYKF